VAAVKFANGKPFVQLMVLLRDLGIVQWEKDDARPIIKDQQAFDAFGFATFLATVFEARWRRRGLFGRRGLRHHLCHGDMVPRLT
jgi:hypothetical protein